MDQIDFEQLSRELFISVRGDMSKTALSRKLGFSAKQVQRWESGARQISWHNFTEACKICERPLNKALQQRLSYHGPVHESALLLNHILGSVRLIALQDQAGISRFSLMRWKKGRCSPPLAVMLRLVDYCNFGLYEFLDDLIEDPSSLASVREQYLQRKNRKEVYFKYPQAAAVIAALNLDCYKTLSRHRKGFISKKLGISFDEECAILKELLAVGRITYENGKYKPSIDSVDLGGPDERGLHRFMSFWINRLLSFYENKGNWLTSSSRIGMEIFAVNSESKRAIREEYRSFQKRVRGILHQDFQNGKPTDEIIIFHTIFYDPSEIGPSAG